MTKSTEHETSKAKSVEYTRFACPEDVLKADDLELSRKIEILRHWEYDVLDQQVAEEEGMGSGKSAALLDRILKALKTLGEGRDGAHAPPTKHGGL